MKAVFLVLLLLAAQASAITTEAFATSSALWQRLWNQGELFTLPFESDADLDGDGKSNYTEFLAGTDPKNGTPPAGVAVLNISYSNPTYLNPTGGGNPTILTPAAASLTWSSVPGKRYQLRVSPDLSTGSWNPVGEAMEGDGSIQGKGITLTQPDGSTPAKLFFRLEIGDTPSSISGSGNSAYHDYILTLHPEYANPGNGGNNPGGGNQNPPPADSDHDGFADEDDAVPTDALIDWKKTPGFQYVWIPADAPTGYKAVNVNNHGQILFQNQAFISELNPGDWIARLGSVPIGKVWDPAKSGPAQWQNLFLNPVRTNPTKEDLPPSYPVPSPCPSAKASTGPNGSPFTPLPTMAAS